MSDENKRIVEINGIKIEVDLRTAKRIDEFKVGSKVKVLIKEYGDTFKSFWGMIVGFDEFKSRPTIIVAYLENGYREDPLKFKYINQDTKDVEICAANDDDLGVSKQDILDQFNKNENELMEKLRELNVKRDYFEKMFGKYFSSDSPT